MELNQKNQKFQLSKKNLKSKELTLVVLGVLIAASVIQFHMQDTKFDIKEIRSNNKTAC